MGGKGRGEESLLDDLWRDDLARTAPGGEAVEHDQLVLFCDGFVELGFPVELPAMLVYVLLIIS